MSEEALAPTLSNFDAIVAAKSAAAEAKPADDAPDTFENDQVSDVDESDIEEVEEEVEAAGEDDADDEEADEPEEDNDPLKQPVEAKLAAPFKAFRESLKTKRVTPELLSALGDLELEVETVNGPAKLRLNEVGGHLMREARFSREMAKTKEDQAKAHHIMQTHQALTNAWRQSPDELARGLEIYGCQEALNILHRRWAEETYSYLNATPEQRQRIQQQKQWQAQQQQQQMRMQQIERENQQLKQRYEQQQFDEPTKQAGDYITKNMDGVLGAALKKVNGGRISDPKRQDFVAELTALAQQGVPLPQAMKEAAEIVADTYAERREIAQAQTRQAEKAKPEVSGKRAPAGGAPPNRDGDGRFKPPTRSSSNGKRKGPATAAAFGERFGV